MTSTPPKVFISYSHGSERHQQRVLDLADRLRADGIDAEIDQYNLAPAEGWPLWCERQVAAADVVLMICTETYCRRVMGEEEPGQGLGVVWEARIIRQLLYDAGALNDKVVPVLFSDVSPDHIPTPIKAWSRYAADTDDGYEALYRRLTGEPLTLRPPIREFRELPVRRRKWTEVTLAKPSPSPSSLPTINIGSLPYPRPVSIGREPDLKDLCDAWNNDAVNVLSLVAAGGAGKSALVRTWLKKMEEQNYQGAVRIFGWSFESGKFNDPAASADEFIAQALEFFGQSTFDRHSPWANGERLADHVRQQRNLLILDGLETLQSDRETERGAIKDPALATLVTALAEENPGLCIITTRVPVADLAHSREHAILKDLEKLSPEAGQCILAEAGVQVSEHDLKKASRDFGGHALALILLASWLKQQYRRSDRHVHHAKDVPTCDRGMPEEKRHPYRVMQAWAKTLRGTPGLEVIYLIGLFSKPVELKTMKVLTDKECPLIAGLNEHLGRFTDADWLKLLGRLDAANLISFRVTGDCRISGGGDGADVDWVDTHPLVREFFGCEFRTRLPDAWRAAHRWLYDYFCKSTPHRPDLLPELEPLYGAIAHGCQAGLYEAALRDVFIERIRRGREQAYSALMLGAHGADLSAISGFFKSRSQSSDTVAAYEEPIDKLEPDDKAFVRGVASFSLRALGRLKEACETRYLALDTSLRCHDWYGASYDAPALAEILMMLGNIRAAQIIARLGV